MTSSPVPHRAVERYQRIKAIGRIPPWWRVFARRRWIRSFDSIMALDISQAAEMLRRVYGQDAIANAANRPAPMFAAIQKAPSVESFRFAVPGKPGMAYECPIHGRFVPSELPRHYIDQPEAKCMAWLPGGLTYCGRFCPPAKVQP